MNKNLIETRKASGKTQTQVAKSVGISPQAYQRYEYGRNEPSVRTAIRIADALEIQDYSTFKALFGAATPESTPPGGNPAK